MSISPKINLYLVHAETGQKYPVASEVVIGRSNGDIVFAEDKTMSAAHCRVRLAPRGVCVCDLGSSTGTTLDGRPLEPKKDYIFQPGSRLLVGVQEFYLHQPKLRSARPTRRKKKKKSSFDFASFFASLVVLAASGVLVRMYLAPAPLKTAQKVSIPSPLVQVERDIKQAFDEYGQIGNAHRQRKLSDVALAQVLRSKTIPRFKSLLGMLNVVRPGSEWERRKVALIRKHLEAMTLQVTAMAAYAQNPNPKDGRNLQHYSAVAESLTRQLENLETKRQPAYFNY